MAILNKIAYIQIKYSTSSLLSTPHGSAVQARLAEEGGAPTVEETKRFSTWTFTTRQNYSPVCV